MSHLRALRNVLPALSLPIASRRQLLRAPSTSSNPSCSHSHRWLSKPVPPILSDEDETTKRSPPTGKSDYLEQPLTLTGVGQVLFLNSPASGSMILASLLIGDPILTSLAALGTVTSTATAKIADLDKNTTRSGLYSYNGCLVGCAASVFVAPVGGMFAAAAFTAAGASSSTFATVALTRVLTPMPQWTFGFNLVTLTSLLYIRPLVSLASEPLTETVNSSTSIADATYISIVSCPLTGLSQIFLVESPLTGLGIVAAIANYSPTLALHAIAGSITGSIVGGCFLGASASDLASGLYGFNSALTCMGVAVVFVPTPQSRFLSIAGAAASSVVYGALSPVFQETVASPCLTLPFCLTMSMCWALASGPSSTVAPLVPGLLLAAKPHSPEKNHVHYW